MKRYKCTIESKPWCDLSLIMGAVVRGVTWNHYKSDKILVINCVIFTNLSWTNRRHLALSIAGTVRTVIAPSVDYEWKNSPQHFIQVFLWCPQVGYLGWNKCLLRTMVPANCGSLPILLWWRLCPVGIHVPVYWYVLVYMYLSHSSRRLFFLRGGGVEIDIMIVIN